MSRVLTDGRRRVLRRWLLIGLIPVALVAVVLATKLISVNVLSGTAQDRFQARAYPQAVEAARGLEVWNWIEPWKAPFDLGVSLVMGGALPEGRAALEEALELHGEPEGRAQVVEHCIIVASLVTAIEKQGDELRESGDQQSANGYYEEALALIAGAGEGCFEEPREGEPQVREQLEAAQPRIEEKIEQPPSGGDDSGEGEGEGTDEPQTPEEQLEQQNEDAQAEQQQQDQYDESGEGQGGPQVDRPW
ncbi:hypothetical protein OVA14_00410 [Agrococcus sp. SL85]|uniref:hypothetical protein n=1 Tax=Agrococcus sp. SL85 TaxID=2995141 RepID=UPI00226CBBCC|nr:hypothetical protein [Agrococcus sp. SL85]WAC66304.1 hypothetical protein OVA14_00410 [Agrococcus sp. SL85]